MIELKNVCKNYGLTKALADVSFSIKKGEIIGFVGPNGAGKTTLLNRILNGSHGLRVAVLVNDFGSINIDTELIVGVEDNAISLANGCVCCNIRDDLVETVEMVINRPENPQYILLEASGVAEADHRPLFPCGFGLSY